MDPDFAPVAGLSQAHAARYIQSHPAFGIDGSDVPDDVLDLLLSVAFFAGTRFEEGARTTFELALFVGTDDPEPGDDDTWTFHRLPDDQAYDVDMITRLARALTPGSSAIAVRMTDDGALLVAGVVHLSAQHGSSLAYESNSRPARPGVLQVVALAPGHLAVTAGYVQIVELKDGQLITELPDIAFEGPVCERLAGDGLERLLVRVAERLPAELQAKGGLVARDWVTPLWQSVVYRVLNRMRQEGLGGALIIVEERPSRDDVRSYPLEFTKLGDRLEDLAVALVALAALPTEARAGHIEWRVRAVAAGRRLSAAIAFVADLTRLDGVTILDRNYDLLGLGGTILELRDPPAIRALDAMAERTKPLEKRRYGTRHRSVMSFCYHVPESVGFIVSQDGDLRATLRHGDELLFWDGFSAENVTWIPVD